MSLETFLDTEIDPSDPLDHLIHSLAQRDICHRGPALRQLIRLPNPWVEDRLFAVLRTLDSSSDSHGYESEAGLVNDDLMQRSIQWIVFKRATQALPALLRAAADDNIRVKAIAIEALGKLGDPRALELALQAIKEDDQLGDFLRWLIDENLGKLVTPDVVTFLLPLALHGTTERQRDLAERLLKHTGTATVPHLLFLLSAQDADLRCRVISLLGELGDPRAVKMLMNTLHDDDVGVRLQSASALGLIRDASATEVLIAALEDADADLRDEILLALERIGTPRLIDVLTDAAHDGDADLRADALTRLYRLGRTDFFPAATAALERVAELHTEFLDDPDELVRGEAALLAVYLGRGDTRVTERLIAALTGPMRVYVVDALGELGDPRAVEPLIAALAAAQNDPPFEAFDQFETGMGDENGLLRDRIVFALGKLGDPRAVDALIGALDDPGFYIRSSAIIALGRLRDQRGMEPLLALLTEGYEVKAAKALAAIGGSQVIEALTTVLIEQQNYPESLWSSVAQALRTLHQSAPAILITKLRQAESLQERCHAAKALGLLGDPRSLDPLLTRLSDAEEEPLVRGAAACALGEMGDERAREPLLTILTTEAPRIVRGNALLALGHMHTPQVLENLLSALGDHDPIVRAATAYVLGEWDDEKILPALLTMEEREVARDDDFRGYSSAMRDLGMFYSEWLPEEFAAHSIFLSRIRKR